MKAARPAGVLAAISLALAGGGFAVPVAAGGGPTTIGVRNGASEFSFALSRTRVSPGRAIIQYTSTGEDPHDVLIKRAGAREVVSVGETPSGGVVTFPQMKLRRDSKYVLWCSLDGHREAGMEAAFRVKRKRR